MPIELIVKMVLTVLAYADALRKQHVGYVLYMLLLARSELVLQDQSGADLCSFSSSPR
jgi:hypothetical protein